MLTQATPRETALSLTWDDGRTHDFHYVWLRDNAPENRHENGQKLIDTLDIPLDIKPAQVTLGDALQITWANDGHVSTYSRAWLQQHSQPTPHVTQRRWLAAHLKDNVPSFDFAACEKDAGALRGMLQAVRDLGFSVVTGVPTDEAALFKVIDLFGYVRETNYGRLFDVRVESNPTNLAFTSRTLGGHTDNPYRRPTPTLQLLHVLANSAAGGESTMVDGFRVAADFRAQYPDDFEILNTAPVRFRFQSDHADLSNVVTIIGTDPLGEINAIHFNNRSMQALNLSVIDTERFYRAYHRFGAALEDPHYRIMFKLNAGDAMLFDNTRVLHGRIGYRSTGNRHLQGCYADMDSLRSKLAVLERNA